MSLSLGTGPFGPAAAGVFNFDLDGVAPPHRIYFADFQPRVRAIFAGRTVLDTTRAKLLYETAIGPRLYAPLDDFTRPSWRAPTTPRTAPSRATRRTGR